ncbi:MAG: heme ABC exporter ATP-binding protein CcmA [Tatlockia sp.]|jgi:heme exporter protein A
MVEVRNITFDYQDKPLINKVNFSLPPGQLLHLQGANGKGKTTLLKLLAGLLTPHSGDILFKGQSIYANLASYQHALCYVGHKAGINLLLSVKENCVFDLHWGRRLPLDFSELLEGFGLGGLENTPCYLLSAGLRRRVSLLRIALTNAAVWLLDEPLIALDTAGVATLMHCLKAHLSFGGQIILTSHQALPFNQKYQEYTL